VSTGGLITRVRRDWRRILRRLVRGRQEPASVLLVPVPSAEGVIAEWRTRHDPTAAHGMPAHVTVLYPFLARSRIDGSTDDALKSLFAGFSPFEFSLIDVDRFPGVLYLVPEPANPFVELTKAIAARWPDHQPYRGEFASVVPHVTVVNGSTEPPDLEGKLRKALPIEATASEVWLMAQDDTGRWMQQGSYQLGAQ
jgi:2'-5' RNA ligase